MKGQELLDVLEYVDPELIVESESSEIPLGARKSRGVWGTLAACFCLFLLAGFLIGRDPRPGELPTEPTAQTDDVETRITWVNAHMVNTSFSPVWEKSLQPVTFGTNSEAFAYFGGVFLPDSLQGDLRIQEAEHTLLLEADGTEGILSAVSFAYTDKQEKLKLEIFAQRAEGDDLRKNLNLTVTGYGIMLQQSVYSKIQGREALLCSVESFTVGTGYYAKLVVPVNQDTRQYAALTVVCNGGMTKDEFVEVLTQIVDFTK